MLLKYVLLELISSTYEKSPWMGLLSKLFCHNTDEQFIQRFLL